MNIQSEELPKLFTDEHYRADNQSMNLSIIKAAEEFVDNEDGDGSHSQNKEKSADTIESTIINDVNLNQKKEEEGTNRENNFLPFKDDKQPTPAKQIEEEETTADNISNKEEMKRLWLLSQYQYEEDDAEVKEESKWGSEDGESNQQELEQESKEARQKFPEEIRLEKLEEEIQEMKLDVNDDANNYIRSKHEIADMKKRLKKMENQAKGLSAKVAKKIEVYESSRFKDSEDQNSIEKNEEGGEEEEAGCGFDLFGEAGESRCSVNTDSADAHSTIINKIEYVNVEIPKGWSGKTPKQMLLEHCRKNKWPKPSFSRMENTINGCIIKLKKQSNHDTSVHADEGPFRTINDAEHFVSTKVLYWLHSELQLHLMMPPSFRNLWNTWLKEKKEKEDKAKNTTENERKEKISSLVAYLGSVVNDTMIDETLNEDGHANASGPLFDDWDDESIQSDSSDGMSATISNRARETVTMISPSTNGLNLKRKFLEKQMEDGYQMMLKSRKVLPIHNFRELILQTVKENPVTVLCAETGKTFLVSNHLFPSLYLDW